MDRKTIKPDYKIMRMILNQCLRRNQNNILFTVLIYVFLSSIATTLPAMIFQVMTGTSISLGMLFLVIILLIGGSIISQYLAYGRDVITARMVEKKHITIGYLFNGFRDKTKRVLKASLLFLLVAFIVGIICITVTVPFFLSAMLKGDSIDMDQMSRIGSIFSVLVMVFSLLATYPFIFTWILMYRMPEATVLECFGLSARLVFRQFFRIIGFFIFCSWKYLLTLAILIPLDFVLDIFGITKTGMGGSLFSIILSIMKIVAEFNALMRIFLAIPVYLFSMTGVLQIHLSEYTPPSQNQELEQTTAEPEQVIPENQADNEENPTDS
ncbi:MAG: hypothetical protein J5857_10570 [Treponema sp.]|nr:hypothetical protein [Treponema sp.]